MAFSYFCKYMSPSVTLYLIIATFSHNYDFIDVFLVIAM